MRLGLNDHASWEVWSESKVCEHTVQADSCATLEVLIQVGLYQALALQSGPTNPKGL